jgi:hypothetical protein
MTTEQKDYLKEAGLDINEFIQTEDENEVSENSFLETATKSKIVAKADNQDLALTQTETEGRPGKGCVTVYQHCNYQGWKITLCGNRAKKLSGRWKNQISSLKVNNAKIRLYRYTTLRGYSRLIAKDQKCLVQMGWNDRANSFRVYKYTPRRKPTPRRPKGKVGCVILYEHCWYGGKTLKYCGTKNIARLPRFWDRQISSLKITGKAEVTFYKYHNYKYDKISFDKNNKCLVDLGWNDKPRSLKLRYPDGKASRSQKKEKKHKSKQGKRNDAPFKKANNNKWKSPVCKSQRKRGIFGFKGVCLNGNSYNKMFKKVGNTLFRDSKTMKKLWNNNVMPVIRAIPKFILPKGCIGDFKTDRIKTDGASKEAQCAQFPLPNGHDLSMAALSIKRLPCGKPTDVNLCAIFNKCGTFGISFSGGAIGCMTAATGIGAVLAMFFVPQYFNVFPP